MFNIVATVLLQWGRYQLIAEMAVRAEEDRVVAPASMGPLSADRGNPHRSGKKSFQSACFNGAAIS